MKEKARVFTMESRVEAGYLSFDLVLPVEAPLASFPSISGLHNAGAV